MTRVLLVVLGLAALIVWQILFIVDERDLALRFAFGEIKQAEHTPGLQTKLPSPFNNVRKFDDRILTLDNRPERFLTGETKYVIVDFFVKWKIIDAAQFYRAVDGEELKAQQRLVEIVTDGMKDEFANRTIQEVVSADRAELMDKMLIDSREVAKELGVNIIDVRVKRIDLPDEVSGSVYDRMRQERARVASQLRAEGVETAERLRSDADRQRTVIVAEAYRDSERIRGDGDATSAETYAQAYEQNPEFYAFHRSLQAYRRALGEGGDILVLDPDSEFFRYFRRPQGDAQ